MMNKIYKVIWNAALQCWVAVSELGKAKGKTKSKKVLSAAAVMAVSAVGVSSNAEAAATVTTSSAKLLAGDNIVPIGTGTIAGLDGVAIGTNANASQLAGIAIGKDSKTSDTSGQPAIAIGANAQALGMGSISFGYNSQATGLNATAIGVDTQSNHAHTLAVGYGAKALSYYSSAIGSHAKALEQYTIAFGKGAEAQNYETIAMGAKALANGESSVAIGGGYTAEMTTGSLDDLAGAKTKGNYAAAVGAGTVAAGSSTAVGTGAKADSTQSVAVGKDTKANQPQAVAVGESAKANSRETVAVGQNATAQGDGAIATGKDSKTDGENAIASGRNAKALADNTIAIGAGANATNNAAGSLVIGRGALVNATDATVVGPVAQASGANATAVGRGAAANGTESTALGRGAIANGNQSIALGQGAQATVDSGVALGDGAVANRVARNRDSIVVNTADPSKTTGLSDNNNGGDANTVYAPVRLVDAPGALEAIKNTIKGNKGAVSVGDSGNTRQIINVAAGSADSDAVNVAQLKAVAGSIKKYSVTSPDGSITITNPGKTDEPQNFQIKMNTTAVQDAAQWYVKEGTETSGTAVRGGNTVSFNDSPTVDVQHNNKNFTFNVKSGDVTTNTNTGAITGPTDGNVLAKAKNVAEAIQRSGWELQANGTKVGLVNPGDKVNIKAGTGVTITPTNENGGVSTLTISAAQQNYSWKLKEDSQTPAQALNVTNNTAVSLKGENYLNITNRNGGNFAFKTVTADVGMDTATGATNQATATGLTTNKAVADAIAKSGFQLKENGTLRNVVNPGESLNFKPGQGTTVSVGTNGDVQVNANVADIQAGNNVTVAKNNGVVTINAKDTQASVTKGNGVTLTETTNGNGTKNYQIGVDVDGTTVQIKNGKLTASAQQNYSWKLKEDSQTADQALNVTNNTAVSLKGENYLNITNRNGGNFAFKTVTADVGMDTATGATNQATATGLTTNKAVADAIAKSGFQLKENGTLRNVVNPGESLNFKPGQGTTVSVGANGDVQVNANVAGITAGKNISTTTDANGNVTINAKDTSAHVKAANNAAVKVDKATATRTENNADITDYTVDLTDQTKTNITHGVNANETVTNKGLTFNGNTGSTGIKKLGSSVDVIGNTSNNVITTTANPNGITVDYNSTAAAQVTNLTYKANNANAKSVTLAKGLDFTNGTQTTAEVGENGVVKFNVNTTTLSSTATNGKITVPTGDGLVTAKEVANAINAAGWNLNVGGAKVQNVKAGDFVNFADGNGTTVTYKDGAVRVNANVSGLTAGNNITIEDKNKDGNFTISATDTNTQVTVANATNSPITIATTQNANGTNHYTVDVNVDDTTIKKENGVLKAVIPAVEKVDLTVNKTGDNAGKVEAPTTDADKGKLVTAENVAKAINESYWVAKRGDSVTTNEDAGDGDSNVAAGNNVTFVAGKNMALQKAGNKFIYATKDDVSFNNVTANNTTTTNLTVKNGGNVDMGGNQVHNVSTGTAPTDAVNVKQLYDTVSGNVSTESVIKKAGDDNIAEVTVADNKKSGDKNAKYEVSVSKAKIKALANETVKVNTSTAANNPITVTPHTENGNTTYTVNFDGEKAASEIPLTYKANDGAGKTVKLSEGLNFKNGTQTTAEVGDNGVVKFNVNTTTLSNTTANGKITVPDGNGLVTAKEVANAINAANWKLNVNGDNKQSVSAGDIVNFANGNGTTVTYKDGAVRVNANVTDVVSANSNATITRDPDTGIVTVNAKDTNTQVTVANATNSPITIATTQNAN
ncbi:ESPR-type extended signal peptide-containing protein, partial [Haemophilus parahaemolyticus]|uniref:ESPR-type extended signal peptide-containing protein n=1 Tax=Haemophilus parahaemolyticus TaxID=735 RepID=UPI0028E9278C